MNGILRALSHAVRGAFFGSCVGVVATLFLAFTWGILALLVVGMPRPTVEALVPVVGSFAVLGAILGVLIGDK